MRVIYVSTLEAGGPVSHLLNLIPAVAGAGVEVEVVCQSDAMASRFAALGVPVQVAPMRSKWDLLAVPRTWRVLAHADVVHSQDRRAGLFARVIGRARGARAVHTYHGLPEPIAVKVGRNPAPPIADVSRLRLAWLLHGYLRVEGLLARLGAVIVPSRAFADFLVAHGLPKSRVHVVRSGIDVRRREPAACHDPPVVAAVGNLEWWKGFDVLIEACGQLTQRFHLDLYGDGSLREHLEREATRLGVDATFHGWVEGVRERIEGADLLALPSRADNLPISVLEAMAAALPVVGSRVGGVPELVVDGETGILVEPDDPAGLARAIEHLLRDEDERVAMGKRAARRAEEEFTAAAAAAETIEIYERLCASST